MHISDGVLSPVLMVGTTVAGLGMVFWSLKGIKSEEIPKVSLMTALFFVSSLIRFPIGPTSIHLLLVGFIGLIAGRRTAVTLFAALLLQLFLLQFGGLSSLGANVLIQSLPATFLGMTLSSRLLPPGKKTFLYGFAAGVLSILGSVLLLSLVLFQSNARFGMGVFSTLHVIILGHIPLMFIEGLITAFAVRFIVQVRPAVFSTGH